MPLIDLEGDTNFTLRNQSAVKGQKLGKFNFRFAAVKVWNNLEERIKYLPLKSFKNKVMSNILSIPIA